MMSDQIESYANVGDIAGPDLNLKVLLRHNVVPMFLADVSYVSWRRKPGSVALVIGDKQKTLPDDFWQMQVVSLNTDLTEGLPYIGEDPQKLLAAEANTNAGKPGGYYLKPRPLSENGQLTSIVFDAPADTSYTAYFAYYTNIYFADDIAPVDFNKYIPAQFQWALVERLKAEIMVNRFGVADNRYLQANEAYQQWVARASQSPELARRNVAIFVR